MEHSDFLFRVFLDRNGGTYTAARKTAEHIFPEDGSGICICRTMASGFDMEWFYLFRRNPRCHSTSVPDNGQDILFEYWYPKDPDIPASIGAYQLWNEKTQGRLGHIPPLAIACLFANRFPDAVNVRMGYHGRTMPSGGTAGQPMLGPAHPSTGHLLGGGATPTSADVRHPSPKVNGGFLPVVSRMSDAEDR